MEWSFVFQQDDDLKHEPRATMKWFKGGKKDANLGRKPHFQFANPLREHSKHMDEGDLWTGLN